MRPPCAIGVDFGTSGCRAIAIDTEQRPIAAASIGLPPPQRATRENSEQDPSVWWLAALDVLQRLSCQLGDYSSAAIAVNGTSATLLLTTPEGEPYGPALMYDDTRSRKEAQLLAAIAPADSPVQSASSSLAKLLHLKDMVGGEECLALHQADWVTGNLSGCFGYSDWHNCLKLGFDPAAEAWPHWMQQLPLTGVRLPRVIAPGALIGRLDSDAAKRIGLTARTLVFSGTTDSTAAVLATGVSRPGEAITVLGSTLVVKILSCNYIAAPQYGVYSHRLGSLWVSGGASNSGGAVLRRFFSDAQIRHLSDLLQPQRPTGLDYYPLLAPGERFPVNDPDLLPRMTPRPAEDRYFFQGLLEGIGRIEAEGYALLQRLGTPAPGSIQTMGGGASNRGWQHIRERLLGVPVRAAEHQQAAYGTAKLALTGWRRLFQDTR